MSRCILHVDLDAFFVSVEQALNPALKGKPVVVGGNPEGRGVVASASYEARAYGIRAGMPLSAVRRRCPQAILLQSDFPRYHQASQRFLSILADFTPEVEPVGLDEAYLDITGLREETAQEVALHLKDRIKGELDLTASIGIATCKVVAKVASDQCKPDGMLEVAPREERRFLTPLPVSQLPGVGRKTEQRLRNMRVTTMGQLADKPLSLLQQTFGVVGERLHCHANGIDESKVRPPAPPKSFGQETTFAEDTLDGSFLRAILYSLSEQVGAELRQQGRQARCITLKLRYADFKTITRSRTLKGATNADRIIFEVGLQLLERALGERRKLVRLLGIRASNLAGTERQLPLLNFTEEKQIQLNQAVDRIRHKYGFDSVYTGKVLPLKEVNQRD